MSSYSLASSNSAKYVRPNIDNSLKIINKGKKESIYAEFNAIVRRLHYDEDEIAYYWLSNYNWDITQLNHQILLSHLFDYVGFKNVHVYDFLYKYYRRYPDYVNDLGIVWDGKNFEYK